MSLCILNTDVLIIYVAISSAEKFDDSLSMRHHIINSCLFTCVQMIDLQSDHKIRLCHATGKEI